MKYIIWLIAMFLLGVFTPWYVTLSFFCVSGIYYGFTFESKGDFDLISGLLGLGVIVVTLVGTIAFLFGKFFF